MWKHGEDCGQDLHPSSAVANSEYSRDLGGALTHGMFKKVCMGIISSRNLTARTHRRVSVVTFAMFKYGMNHSQLTTEAETGDPFPFAKYSTAHLLCSKKD